MSLPARSTLSGIGGALRAERERLRISIDAVERGTLIRREFLLQIETEKLDRLPSGAYAKGFIRSYAAFLGLDPAPFVAAYEEHVARPEPELARVVRRGVRVPPDRQRRGWTFAVSGAASVILLLALLGAFRSDGKAPEVPKAAAVAARVAEVMPNPTGTVLTVEVTGESSWIEVVADGQHVFGETLVTGDSRTFKATESILLTVARPREVSIVANGHVLGTPDLDTYEAVFTPDTTELPPPEEAAPAAAGTEPAQP